VKIGLHALGASARIVATSLRSRKALAWALTDQLIVSAANFLTTIVVARALGIEDFGYFALTWAVLLFGQSLLSAFIVFPMMSILPQLDASTRAAYLPPYVSLAALTAIIVPIAAVPPLLVFLSTTISSSLLGTMVPLVVASVALQAHEILRRLAFALGRPERGTLSDVVRYLALGAGLWLIVSNFQVDAGIVFWLQGGAALAGTAACIGIVPLPSPELSSIVGVARRHWSSARWLLGSAVLSWVTANWLYLVVGQFVGAGAIGGIRASETLMGVFSVLVQSLQNVVPVNAARRLHAGGPVDLARYVDRVVVVLLLVGCTVSAGAALLAGPLFHLAFGPEFAQHSGLLLWFGLVATLVAIELPVSAGLRAMEKTGPIFHSYLASAAWMIVAGTAATFVLGLPGAVGAFVATWAMRVGFIYLALRRHAVGR